jgi:hypothetical protein
VAKNEKLNKVVNDETLTDQQFDAVENFAPILGV